MFHRLMLTHHSLNLFGMIIVFLVGVFFSVIDASIESKFVSIAGGFSCYVFSFCV